MNVDYRVVDPMVRTGKRTVALYVASIVVAGLQPVPASTQEVPESSLSALFPVADVSMVDPLARQAHRPNTATFVGDARFHPSQDADISVGAVAILSATGTVAGDIAGAYLLLGCALEWCEDYVEGSINLIGAAALAVGTPATGAALGGGDFRWALAGSGLGLVAGGLAGGALRDTPGVIVLLGIHATMTTLFALR